MDYIYYLKPYNSALFKDKWYNIKQLIEIAKEEKHRNSAPIRYQIEIEAKYWESIFCGESITDRKKQQERNVQEKQTILAFLAGAENSNLELRNVISRRYDFYGEWRNVKILSSGESRRIRDCLIFSINDCEVFLYHKISYHIYFKYKKSL